MWGNQKDMQMAVSMTSPSTGICRQGDQDQPTAGTIPSPSFFSTAKPDKAVHRSICGLAPCFSAPRSLHFLSPYRAQGTGTGNYYSIIVNGKR